MVLDVHSGEGRTIEELLQRLPAGVRVLGLEPSEALRALAKSRIVPEWKNRVYLKAEDVTAVADMGDALYDLVVANLVLSEAHDLAEALEGLIRVTKPGGTLLATLQMRGTWSEAEDLLREVLRDEGLSAAQNRLRRMASLRPTGPDVARALEGLGLSKNHFVVEQERFKLLFGSGREFLFAPLVELGPLRLWKAVVATEGNPQQAFFRFKEAIDAYCSSGLFSVTAVAGAITLRRPAPDEDPRTLPGARYWDAYPQLQSLWSAAERGEIPGEELEGDIDIELDLDSSAPAAAPRTDPVTIEEGVTAPHAVVRQEVSSEDEAILALLETPAVGQTEATNLDALLDQVLEFEAKPKEAVEEIDPDELEMIDVDPRQPGDTLKRIKALLPPLPVEPPPPPKKPK